MDSRLIPIAVLVGVFVLIVGISAVVPSSIEKSEEVAVGDVDTEVTDTDEVVEEPGTPSSSETEKPQNLPDTTPPAVDEPSIEPPVVEDPPKEDVPVEEPAPEPQPEPEPEPAPEPEPEPEPSDLVLHLKFDEGSGSAIGDSSGYGNHGTLFNADFLYTWAAGVFNTALKFDNNDDYVSVPHSDSLNVGEEGQNYTVAFWFQRFGNTTTERLILGKGPDNISTPFLFRVDSTGRATFRVSNGINAPTVKLATSITGQSNTWHHLAGVRDVKAGLIRFYVDGKEGEQASVDTATGSLQNSGELRINRTKVGQNSYFSDPFVIDDLRIHTRALSTSEIKALFDAR